MLSEQLSEFGEEALITVNLPPQILEAVQDQASLHIFCSNFFTSCNILKKYVSDGGSSNALGLYEPDGV